jgi:hypothetical protein
MPVLGHRALSENIGRFDEPFFAFAEDIEDFLPRFERPGFLSTLPELSDQPSRSSRTTRASPLPVFRVASQVAC